MQVLSNGDAPFPAVISLPTCFQPEGIAIGKGTTFYVGSLASGAIYKGDLRTGDGAIFAELDTPSFGLTSGLAVDQFDRVWVAGGVLGGTRVYDGDTGELLETYVFDPQTPAVINDVTVTPNFAIFTDSGSAADPFLKGSPRIFILPLQGDALPPPADAPVVELAIDEAPDIAFPNLNGIETLPGYPNKLIVCHTTESKLYFVDTETGVAVPDPVEIASCDGLVRSGNLLYVVEPGKTVAEIQISEDTESPTLTRITTYNVTGSEQPTTAGLFGNAIYVVDGKFNIVPPGTSCTDTTYEVYRIETN